MSDYPDDFINNLRGKFQGDREATIKHLIETGHKEKEATAIADHIQMQIKGDKKAHEDGLKKNYITDFKERFGILSDEAREGAFGKMPGNEEKVYEILNELVDLIPTLSNREHPCLHLTWLSIIGKLVKEDGFDKYVAALFSTAGLHIVKLKKDLERPAEIKVVKVT